MIDDKLKQEILAHAEQCKPQESCGFVVFDGRQNIYIPCVNVSPDPINYFEIAPEEFIAAEEIGHIVALVHSHPDSAEEKGLPYLSTADRECQVQLDLDFWLVVGGEIKRFRNIPPLLGRQFENNKQDCRNILLDCYMLAGADFPDDVEYPFNWFEQKNLYEDNLLRFGFLQAHARRRYPAWRCGDDPSRGECGKSRWDLSRQSNDITSQPRSLVGSRALRWILAQQYALSMEI